jgi:hypothetical protein
LGHLAGAARRRDHPGVDGSIEREDVDAILSGIFDFNVALARIDLNLAKLVAWLDMGGDDEGEEEDPPEPPA